MHGGVVLFRGAGADARRYVESDRSRADDYYLSDSTDISYLVRNTRGDIEVRQALTSAEYSDWVDWILPSSGETMGRPRTGGPDRRGLPASLKW